MMYQRTRIGICIVLILTLALVLPLFGGCAKEEVNTTTAEEDTTTAEEDTTTAA